MPRPLIPSKLPLRLPSRSMEAFSWAMASLSRSASSMAASSASGESGIVSKEEIDGERERKEVGVLGMDDAVEKDGAYGGRDIGYASLYLGEAAGEAVERRVGEEELIFKVARDLRFGWRFSEDGKRCAKGDAGVLRVRGKVPL